MPDELHDQQPQKVAPILCPECRAGKHINCDGIAWDDTAGIDAQVECHCTSCATRTDR